MPELAIDIEAIGRNTEVVSRLLRARSLDLVAVTKGCLGEPRVAAAMLEAGAVALADSRDQNLQRLRRGLPSAELHRIGLPSLAREFETGDLTYITTWEAAEAVARLGGSVRRVMVQVESGDGREGVPSEAAQELASRIASDERLELEGIATNYACFRGSPEGLGDSLQRVASAAVTLRAVGLPIRRVSGGNSSVLWSIARGASLPAEVTELRCGEALLLGRDTLYYEPLEGCRGDACTLRAEVVEEYTRPTPGGPSRRLLLGVGRQDLGVGGVEFVEPGLCELGRSSDYLVVDAGPGPAAPRVGTTIEMIPGYEALVAAWASPHVGLKFQD